MKIVIAGDFVVKSRVESLCDQREYEKVMGQTKAICKEYDYRIVNLESPVYTGDNSPITKCGPALKSKQEAVSMLEYANFDCVTLANNHFYDFADAGVKETIETLNRHNIKHVGGGKNLKEASENLYVDIGGETLAIINCAEHEFSIATNDSGGSNPLNPVAQYHAITEARKKADYVLVIVHGGIEGYNKPTPRMQETFRFFVEIGADAVVNHHQHCFSGYETYKGKPIFYGLGNFCFDYPQYHDCPWNFGYMAGITFGKDGISFKLHPYNQCGVNPDVEFLNGKDLQHFQEEMDKINLVISDPKAVEEEHIKYMEDHLKREFEIFTPYRTYLGIALFEKHLLPFYYPDSKWPIVLNRIECESHRERLIYFVKKQMK